MLAHALAPVTNHLDAGPPPKPTTTHLTLKEGRIGSEKIMSLCVGTGIYMHVWYSASLIGLLNMTQYLHQNYYRVKERFLESIDYVEDVTKEGQAEDESLRVRRSPGESPK